MGRIQNNNWYFISPSTLGLALFLGILIGLMDSNKGFWIFALVVCLTFLLGYLILSDEKTANKLNK